MKSARVAHLVRHSEEYGIRSGGPEVDFPAVMDRVEGVVAEAGEHDSPERFRGLGVDVFTDDRRGKLRGSRPRGSGWPALRTRSAIIATGSHPSAPPVEGLEEVGYLTNVGALELRRPARAALPL